MADNLPYLSVTPHLKSLRCCGFYQLGADSSKMKKTLHFAYMLFISFFVWLYTFQQIMKVYKGRHDLNTVIDTMFLLLTNSDCIYKQIVFWKKAKQIEVLLNILKGTRFNQKKPEHKEFLLEAIGQARFLLRGFNISAVFTCLLWVLYPVILYSQRKHVEFAIWLPFDANLSPHFYFAIFYVWVQTSWLAFSNTSMDAFITSFLVQCKAQLSILRLDLEQLVEKSKEEVIETSGDFREILERRLKIILLHYNEIFEFSNLVLEIFGGSIMYLFMISGWIMCTSAYRIVDMKPMSVEFASMAMYMFCILVEVFMYCYYGNEVTYESEKLMESAYSLDWLVIPIKYRRALILFMERIKRNMNLLAGNLIPISNSTFVSVVRSSYTFYAFLKNSS